MLCLIIQRYQSESYLPDEGKSIHVKPGTDFTEKVKIWRVISRIRYETVTYSIGCEFISDQRCVCCLERLALWVLSRTA